MGFDYLYIFLISFHWKNVWILLSNIFIICHLIITIFDLLTFILRHSQMLFIYFYFITFLLQSLLWRGKYQKTIHAINRRLRKIQATKEILYLVVVDHNEVGNSNFFSRWFCDHLGKIAL